MRVLANEGTAFPDPRTATGDGLVAIGGDLSLPRLLAAYRHGIFPWSIGPITWWSPDPRAVIELDQLHVPGSLAKVIRKAPFQITHDRAFGEVIAGCAAPAPGRGHTWISPEFVSAYIDLHRAGHAHCVECWQSGELVGGIYGVSVGGFFAGESMFHLVSHASKVALVHLIEQLRARGFALFDIQMVTPVTRSLGAHNIPRVEFLRRLRAAVELDCSF